MSTRFLLVLLPWRWSFAGSFISLFTLQGFTKRLSFRGYSLPLAFETRSFNYNLGWGHQVSLFANITVFFERIVSFFYLVAPCSSSVGFPTSINHLNIWFPNNYSSLPYYQGYFAQSTVATVFAFWCAVISASVSEQRVYFFGGRMAFHQLWWRRHDLAGLAAQPVHFSPNTAYFHCCGRQLTPVVLFRKWIRLVIRNIRFYFNQNSHTFLCVFWLFDPGHIQGQSRAVAKVFFLRFCNWLRLFGWFTDSCRFISLGLDVFREEDDQLEMKVLQLVAVNVVLSETSFVTCAFVLVRSLSTCLWASPSSSLAWRLRVVEKMEWGIVADASTGTAALLWPVCRCACQSYSFFACLVQLRGTMSVFSSTVASFVFVFVFDIPPHEHWAAH